MITSTETSAALLGIARAWAPLTEAVQDARQHAWPPLTLRQYLAQSGDEEELEARTWRAEALRALERDPAQIGRRPVPLRLDLIGTIALIEAGLLELADTTAAMVQRPRSPRPGRAAPRTPRPGRSASCGRTTPAGSPPPRPTPPTSAGGATPTRSPAATRRPAGTPPCGCWVA
ncbi:hypothetical protein ACFQ60_22510 [Streptomyces zhihengii]